MVFVKEYVHYEINIKDVDEIIVKSSSDCYDRYIHSYSSRLIFNVKILGGKDNKTKDKVFIHTSTGMFLFPCRMRENGYKVIKMKKLTLRYYSNIDDLNICYRLKLGLPFSTIEAAFYKNIATNGDYINNYCVPIQSDFNKKCIMWYLYNTAKNQMEFEELWNKFFG